MCSSDLRAILDGVRQRSAGMVETIHPNPLSLGALTRIFRALLEDGVSIAHPLPILAALSGAHFLNDLIQSMIPAMYPLLKEAYRLDFAEIGFITLAFQVTSSLLQPVLGLLTDRKPWPYAMVAGMGATLAGLLGLAFA